MNGRTLAGEFAALAAEALWVFAGTALIVAVVGNGATVSFAAAAAAVLLSYGLARLLRRIDFDEEATRLWGAAVSIGLLYLILRINIGGDPYLWELGWVGDLLREPGRTLEGGAGDVATVVLLAAAWVRGVMRGSRDLTFEGILADVSLGLLVVLGAAAFAPSADAPGAIRWLPVPYLVAGFLALALAHLQSVEADSRRPFLGAWTLWTGGFLGAIAGLALLASFFDPASLEAVADGLALEAVGDGLALAGKGLVVAIILVLSPFILALGWVMEGLGSWLGSGDEFILDPEDMSGLAEQLEENEREPAPWARVLARVFRSGLVVLAIVGALTALWLVFRRLARRREEEEAEVREDVAPGGGSPLGDLRALLSGALGRLRGLAAGEPRGRDAIGRLYLTVLRRAAAEGLPRPPSATPLEFAVRLEEHFGSPVPGAISEAFAKARYARRRLPPNEMAELQARWRQVARGDL